MPSEPLGISWSRYRGVGYYWGADSVVCTQYQPYGVKAGGGGAMFLEQWKSEAGRREMQSLQSRLVLKVGGEIRIMDFTCRLPC